MTSPPRLAPLETMDDNDLEMCEMAQCVGQGTHAWTMSQLSKALMELQAQRLARARARREALEEAIAVVESFRGGSDLITLSAIQHGLVALRDREEA